MAADDILMKMHIYKLQPRSNKFESEESVEALITSTIAEFGEADNPKYLAHPFDKWNPDDRLGFRSLLFYSVSQITPSSANFYKEMTDDGTAPSLAATTTSTIQFLYRKINDEWELFALTNNEGGQVARQLADYGFPDKIAHRLMDTTAVSSQVSYLAGEKHSSKDTYKAEGYGGQSYETDSIWKYFRSFQTHFLPNSSLENPKYKISAFCTPDKKRNADSKVTVEFGSGRILISKPMTMNQYMSLLVHFSRISRGEPTQKIVDGTERDETDNSVGFKFLRNIRLVESNKTRNSLRDDLVTVIWKIFSNSAAREAPSGNISFWHHFQEYHRVAEKKFSYGTMVISDSRPEISTVMKILRRFFQNCDEEAFRQELNNVTVSFGKHKNIPIIDFFRGEIRRDMNSVYFHVDKMWLTVDADHHATIQSDFSRLVKECLIQDGSPGSLPLRWFKTEESVSFLVSEILANASDETKTIWQVIRAAKFQFLCPSSQKVQTPILTHALFDESGKKLSKGKKAKILDRWDQLSELMIRKHRDRTSVTIEDIEKIFPSQKGTKLASIVMDALKVSRNVVKPMGFKTLAPIIDSKNIPCETSLDMFQALAPKELEKNRKAIERLLRRSPKGEPITATDLSSHGLDPTAVLRQLKKLQKLKETDGTRKYVIQGPLPFLSHLGTTDPLLVFLEEKYKQFCSLRPYEEGYNRLYLNKDGYLVFDQVFPSKTEKVEICDLLDYSDPNKSLLYLYAVKEGCDHRTRDATSQIRVSALTVQRAEAGDTKPLDDLLKKVMSNNDTSPFRKRLRERLCQLCPNTTLTSSQDPPKDVRDAFIQLFRRNQIVFVYAFLDSNSSSERHLSEEIYPSHQFRQEDFIENAFSELIQAGFLDHTGRITGAFMNSTAEDFKMKLPSRMRRSSTALRQQLQARTSSFHSLIMKMELLHLREFFRRTHFTFKIFQIRGRGSACSSDDSGELPAEATQSQEAATQPQNRKEINVGGISYSVGPTVTFCAVMAHLFGVEDASEQLLEHLYLLWAEANQIPRTEFDCTLQMCHRVSQRLKCDLIVVDAESNEIEASSSRVDNPSRKAVFCQVGNEWYHCYNVQEQQECHHGVFLSALGENASRELLNVLRPTGILNGGRDCFFIAAFQLFLNSRLRTELLSVTNSPKSNLLQHLAIQYAIAAKSDRNFTGISAEHDRFRRLFGFESQGADDAASAVEKILSLLDVAPLKYKETLILTGESNGRWQDKPYEQIKEKQDFQLYVPITDDLNSSLDAYFNEEKGGPRVTIDGTEHTFALGKAKCEITHTPEDLFIILKRFDFLQAQNASRYIGREVDIPSTLRIGQADYILQGFVSHESFTSDANLGNENYAGHYIAHVSSFGGWFKLDDQSREKISDEDALRSARKGYIFRFEKKSEENDATAPEHAASFDAATFPADNDEIRTRKREREQPQENTTEDDMVLSEDDLDAERPSKRSKIPSSESSDTEDSAEDETCDWERDPL